jgi:hypothetical protein
VVHRYRDGNANLRTNIERIIQKAGLKPWPKLFQNLRSTRETELAETFPIHVVCAWIGTSEAVAKKHYLQVTDEHFAAESQSLQNPVQQPAAGVRKMTKQGQPSIVSPSIATSCMTVLSIQYPRQDSNLRPSV